MLFENVRSDRVTLSAGGQTVKELQIFVLRKLFCLSIFTTIVSFSLYLLRQRHRAPQGTSTLELYLSALLE